MPSGWYIVSPIPGTERVKYRRQGKELITGSWPKISNGKTSIVNVEKSQNLNSIKLQIRIIMLPFQRCIDPELHPEKEDS